MGRRSRNMLIIVIIIITIIIIIILQSAILHTDHLVRLVVKASAFRAKDLGFDSRLRVGILSGSSHSSDLKKLALQLLSCQAPGVIESALGLVGPVSVYCDSVM